ncbi:putative 2OG-Fe(II) oxygenase [Nocardioides humi]|nr:putative 2OG-Fe(II) oxygenase [Nocardioides humi]
MTELPGLSTGLHLLWPTPIGIHRYDAAAAFNPLLVEELSSIREDQERQRGVEPGGPFFASDDDLLQRVKLDGWSRLVQFVVNGIAQTVEQVNLDHWAGRVRELTVSLEGLWFQAARDGAAHDVHTHGNCSWSGVYIVQIDPPSERTDHPVYGAANGVTRLYGPHFTTMGGAFVDVGNAYLQQSHLDVDQVAGQLLVFPSWLMHQAMAYGGARERVILSFNASIHGSEGDQMFDYAPR